MTESTEQSAVSGEVSVSRETKSTFESGSSKEAFVESRVGSAGLSADGIGRRQRLLYAGLLAAATLALTAMVIASSASSSNAEAQGAARDATESDETENPWPAFEERRVTAEEEGYYYYNRRTASREAATRKFKSKRRRRRGEATKDQTTTTTVTTPTTTPAAATVPYVSTVSVGGRSEEPEHSRRGRLGDVRDTDLAGRGPDSRGNASSTDPQTEVTSSPSTQKPVRPRSQGTESTHKKRRATSSGEKSQPE
ncbi:uncharacterized protein [Dermacentor andersoni]|uniref:uncharacterized protein isoform X2 n=1 Tax=Dermacentor andersoni TaxID=34620 RepID=UPI00241738D1|nr:uncharacterized protein LOC129383791 isoform X2 [Dermacentor andersoni]